MINLLYLLVGISLKQTVDEVKALVHQYITYLERQRETLKTYTPNPAIIAGSVEAARAIAIAQHSGIVAPQVHKLSRRILLLKLIPLLIYLGTTAVLMCCVLTFEAAK